MYEYQTTKSYRCLMHNIKQYCEYVYMVGPGTSMRFLLLNKETVLLYFIFIYKFSKYMFGLINYIKTSPFHPTLLIISLS